MTRAASRESCLKASEQLLASASDVGYSSELLLSRALVLEAATSVLTDYTARRAYDRAQQIEIPYNELPGVSACACRPRMADLTPGMSSSCMYTLLSSHVCAHAGAFVLMQEAGDVQPVITWGRAWLQDNGLDRRAADVALVAALAHCDLAGARLIRHLPRHQADGF